MKSIRSIISRIKLPISAAMISVTLPETIQTLIPYYPVIATELKIYGLLDVRR